MCRAITSFRLFLRLSRSLAAILRRLVLRPSPFSPPSRPLFPSLSTRHTLDMASQSSTTTTYPARAYSQANPIDLTLDDDEDDIHVTQRMQKRVCTMNRSFNATCTPSASTSSAYSRQSSSGLSPAMSHSSLAQPGAPSAPSGSRLPQPPQPSSYYREHYEVPSPNEVRAAHFQGPSNSAAFFHSRPPHVAPPVNPLDPHPTSPNGSPPSNGRSNGAGQVIDLTSSPSPPPQSRPPLPQLQPQPPPPPQMRMQPIQPNLGNLPMDLPPKTPVCIGVLIATALVLYPIPYLNPQEHGQDSDWAPVRLQYEHVEGNGTPGSSSENINIRPPSVKGHNGEIIPGETFAVVEQRVATHLGPMLGKGLIRLDAKIRRVNQAVSAHIVC